MKKSYSKNLVLARTIKKVLPKQGCMVVDDLCEAINTGNIEISDEELFKALLSLSQDGKIEVTVSLMKGKGR